jgi:hypothetical protein
MNNRTDATIFETIRTRILSDLPRVGSAVLLGGLLGGAMGFGIGGGWELYYLAGLPVHIEIAEIGQEIAQYAVVGLVITASLALVSILPNSPIEHLVALLVAAALLGSAVLVTMEWYDVCICVPMLIPMFIAFMVLVRTGAGIALRARSRSAAIRNITLATFSGLMIAIGLAIAWPIDQLFAEVLGQRPALVESYEIARREGWQVETMSARGRKTLFVFDNIEYVYVTMTLIDGSQIVCTDYLDGMECSR